MKQTVIIGSLLIGSLFASSPPNTVEHIKKAPENVGHFTIAMGANAIRDNSSTMLSQIGFGYQTKIRDNSYIQSVHLELVPSIQMNLCLDDTYSYAEYIGSVYLPKISLIRYINSAANNRFFYSLGSFYSHAFQMELELVEDANNPTQTLEPYMFKNCSASDFDVRYGQSIGASFGVGVEFGAPSGAVSILKLEYNQPIRHLEFLLEHDHENFTSEKRTVAEEDFVLDAGSISLTFGIGF